MSAAHFAELFESHVCRALREYAEAVLAASQPVGPPSVQALLDVGFGLQSAERRVDAVRVGPWAPALVVVRDQIIRSTVVARVASKPLGMGALIAQLYALGDEGLDNGGGRAAADALAIAQASARR
jgi:hypothetical protein